jgi:hypothetical protein
MQCQLLTLGPMSILMLCRKHYRKENAMGMYEKQLEHDLDELDQVIAEQIIREEIERRFK